MTPTTITDEQLHSLIDNCAKRVTNCYNRKKTSTTCWPAWTKYSTLCEQALARGEIHCQ